MGQNCSNCKYYELLTEIGLNHLGKCKTPIAVSLRGVNSSDDVEPMAMYPHEGADCHAWVAKELPVEATERKPE